MAPNMKKLVNNFAWSSKGKKLVDRVSRLGAHGGTGGVPTRQGPRTEPAGLTGTT
jgi:hypothetical protein